MFCYTKAERQWRREPMISARRMRINYALAWDLNGLQAVKQSFCFCPIKFCPNRANSQKIQCLTGAQYTPAKWMASWRCWNVPFLDFFLIRFFKRAYLRNFSFYKADVTSVIWSVQGKCLMSAGLRVAYRNVWFLVLAFALHAYHRSPQHIG